MATFVAIEQERISDTGMKVTQKSIPTLSRDQIPPVVPLLFRASRHITIQHSIRVENRTRSLQRSSILISASQVRIGCTSYIFSCYPTLALTFPVKATYLGYVAKQFYSQKVLCRIDHRKKEARECVCDK